MEKHRLSRVKLDRIDISILANLSQDGRMSNVSLADAVGLSPSPCLQRVKRLENAGIISGYGARIELSRVVEAVTIFTEVTLVDHRRENFIRFENGIRNVLELQECHLVSGGYDYLLRFICRSIAQYQEMMEGLLERNLGIVKYFSYIVIKSPIIRDRLPVKELIDK